MEFSYRARTRAGSVDKGTLLANTEADAIKLLRERELIIVSLKPLGATNRLADFFGRINLRDRILFTQELGLMMRAGIPLARALIELQAQTTSRQLEKILQKLAIDVQGGTSFSEAMVKYPRAFSPLMISVIKSGEASGQMVEVLDRLTEQMEKDADLRGKVKSALIYPSVLSVGIIAVLIMIVIFVVPQLKSIFDDAGVELPGITRFLIALAGFLTTYGLYLLAVLIGLVFVFLALIRSPKGGYIFDRYKLHLPIFGPLSQKVSIARMATTSSTLLSAGLPVLEVLKISQDVVGNQYYRRELERVTRATETGTQLSVSLQKGGVFPRMVGNLIAVGEESGSLDLTFKSVALFYERDVETTTRNLTTLLEPLLMLGMGLGVGFVVASVLIPIAKLVESV